MIPILDYEKTEESAIFQRNTPQSQVTEPVQEIIARVRSDGDRALFAYSRLFDKVEVSSLEVTGEELEDAMEQTDKELISILTSASENIRAYHSQQKRTGFSFSPDPGVVLGQKITPLEKVGIYVPGGTAAYPSTVLMTAIPAKIAGCHEIVMVSPPDIAPAILAAAKIAGVDRIFRVGGAQAIAALAYGTESIPRVDKIVGPGNAYVAEAKRQVFGQVAIDMIAGPSEILIIADEKSNPAHVAADLLSQAEHDRLASAVLITTSRDLAEQVQKELEAQLLELPRKEIARASLEGQGKIILASSIPQAIQISNRLAPEHLELMVEGPMGYLDAITNAGSVFLGRYCPEPVGDYWAGPNHTLPTGGTARFSSPLSVDDFVKKSQFTAYSQEALQKAGGKIAAFAQAEGLQAHARSVTIREEGL